MEAMVNVMGQIIQLLVGGIEALSAGIGSGLSQAAQDMFLTVSEAGAVTGLSTFGALVAIFGGIGLAVGLTRLIFNWVTSLGN